MDKTRITYFRGMIDSLRYAVRFHNTSWHTCLIFGKITITKVNILRLRRATPSESQRQQNRGKKDSCFFHNDVF